MRALLDTSVLIADGIEPIDGELAISAVTLAELQFGILVTTKAQVRAERLRRLAAVQHHFDPLPVDAAVAGSYARLAAAAVAAGRQPRARVLDLLIAATAHAHDIPLVTRNPGDLRGLEDLVTIVEV